MVDDALSGDGQTASVCPWCSATYAGDPENCPSCGATLTGEAASDPSLPGLTAIDAAAIVRAKQPVAKPRNRLISWISGEYPDDSGSPADAGALAPPDLDVRREMLRLELEAEVANLQAEADAMMAEAAVEGLAPGATPEDAQAAEEVVADLEAVSAELDEVEEEIEEMPAAADAAAAPADIADAPAPGGAPASEDTTPA
jgi:hypothetical protein